MKYYIMAIYFALCPLISCKVASFEETFYNRPRREWSEAFKSLSIEEKWSVYLYGVRNREPPPLGFAIDLAKEKYLTLGVMIPVLINSKEGYEIRASSYVLDAMRNIVGYDPCSYAPFRDSTVQAALINKVPEGEKYKCSE